MTWGGETYNILLAALLAREAPGLEFEASPFNIVGPVDEIPISIEWVRQKVAAAEAAGDLPLSVARKFTNPSKFLGELSDDLAAVERRRSIPWAPFRRWLQTVEALDRIEEAGAAA